MVLAWLGLIMVCIADSSRSYYEVVGLPPTCSPADLKKNYRSLALKYHPDRITDPQRKATAEEEFVVIAKANDVLSNPELRKRYDELLKDGIFTYDEEEWEERAMRKQGWRSRADDEAAEGWALMLSGLVLLGTVAYTAYIAYNKTKPNEAAKNSMLNNLKKLSSKPKARSSPSSPKGKNGGENSRQAQHRQAQYTKDRKVYLKNIRKTFRGLVDEHKVWFAPKIGNDDISLLCERLDSDELVGFTLQLCQSLSVPPPVAPVSGEKVSRVLPSATAKDTLKRLAAAALRLRHEAPPEPIEKQASG